jgi:hypothetical protein
VVTIIFWQDGDHFGMGYGHVAPKQDLLVVTPHDAVSAIHTGCVHLAVTVSLHFMGAAAGPEFVRFVAPDVVEHG